MWHACKRNAYKGLVGKHETLLRRPTHKCEEDIKSDLKELAWKALHRIPLWLNIGTSGRLL
jgi:hypothetical protein